MFGEDALISMANGSFKPINTIIKGDRILNKFKKITTVLKLYIHNNQDCVNVTLDNGTNTFCTSPKSIIFCYYRLPDSSIISEYCHISHVYQNKGHIKSDLRIFSPESNVAIESYTSTNPVTLYSLYTSDNSQSYIVNKIIVTNNSSEFNTSK